ncbi:MAG: type II toxin-antitoxin system HicB family antitoxin [Halobacteriota archaeon]
MDYEVELEQDDEGYYVVRCPIFKSCHTFGLTKEQALENIKEVIDMCIDEVEIEGQEEVLDPKYAHIMLLEPRSINLKIRPLLCC